MKNITQQKTRGSKFARIVLAGIIATIAFNGVMYVDIAITGIPLDIVATMGSLTVGESEYTETVGHVIHFANGIGLALLFGYVALPISKKIIKLPVIVYAIVFAIVELVIAVWFVMLPMLGAGIAGLNIAPEVAVMTFARHVVFGAVIGLVLRKESTK
ncbi:MAG: DUF2938 family protein [Nitrosopumilus sp.]